MSAGDSVVYSIAEKGTGNRGGKDNNGGGSGATLSGSYEVTKQDLSGGNGRNKKGKGGRRGRSGEGEEMSVELMIKSNAFSSNDNSLTVQLAPKTIQGWSRKVDHRFGEICSCCCFPLLPQLTQKKFSQPRAHFLAKPYTLKKHH